MHTFDKIYQYISFQNMTLVKKISSFSKILNIFKLHRSFSNNVMPDKNEFNQSTPRILITGGLGQLGLGLVKKLRSKYGKENVILSDIVKLPNHLINEKPYIYADILDLKNLQNIVVNEEINWVVHLSALLSAIGETNVPLSIRINIEGVHNILELAKKNQIKLFIPSTIGAFGPDSPLDLTPDKCIQRPRTIYGVAKVHAELLGEYYHYKFGVDFRCLRLPGVISSNTTTGGGTTDYAVQIFNEALKFGKYKCYLKPNTRLPMIYIDDCLRSIIEFMTCRDCDVKSRTYNITAISFTPKELENAIRKYIPQLEVTYQPDWRQNIADSWPRVLDDTNARADWNWKHEYDLDKLCCVMIENVCKTINNNLLTNEALKRVEEVKAKIK